MDGIHAQSHWGPPPPLCARCHRRGRVGQTHCAGCGASWAGAGRFDCISGSGPSEDFAFLFPRRGASLTPGEGRRAASAGR